MSASPRHDAVIVGGGHNALVCAAYLGRAGMRVLVLERGESLGGAAVTAELAPGVRVPRLADTVGRLRASVIRDLALERHGLRLLQPAVRVFAPQPDGGAVTLWGDPARTAEELRARSPADAAAYPEFDRRVRALASFVAYLHAMTPPDLKELLLPDLRSALRLGLAFRRLGERGGREVLRVLPMAVADLVGEVFDDDALRGALATRGVRYTGMGPWSAGTAGVLLGDSVGADRGAAGQAAAARGGPGALVEALAAACRSLGVQLRTGAEVAAILTDGDRATGVALAGGEEIAAGVVVSGTDPKRTVLDLLDPVETGPTLRWRAGGIRMAGTAAKVNLVLDGLPDVPAAGGDRSRLEGRIVVAGGIDDLERAFDAAKYGRLSERPYLDLTIPTLVDPSLAPDGVHVMSVLAQWAPRRLREGDWDAERETLGDRVLTALEEVAPGIGTRVTAREVLTPLDLERDHGLTEGHPLHGEPGLDQFFAWRPMLGHARYRLALPGLYLCGAGAHPGGGITGAPGANAAREVLADRRR